MLFQSKDDGKFFVLVDIVTPAHSEPVFVLQEVGRGSGTGNLITYSLDEFFAEFERVLHAGHGTAWGNLAPFVSKPSFPEVGVES